MIFKTSIYKCVAKTLLIITLVIVLVEGISNATPES